MKHALVLRNIAHVSAISLSQLSREAKSHNRIAAFAILSPRLLYQLFFQVAGIGNHFTIGNLLIACAMVTKFADAQRAFCS